MFSNIPAAQETGNRGVECLIIPRKRKLRITAGAVTAIACRFGTAYGSLRSQGRPAEAAFIVLIAMTM